MELAQSIVQNAYVVQDIDQAIQRWHRLWGLGPFLVRRHMAMAEVRYRGQLSQLDISAAFAQAGPIQVELLQQHCQTPSAFRDMFAGQGEGLHHVAVQVTDPEALLDRYRSCGLARASELRTAGGRGAVLVDTRPLVGHMTEVYLSPDATRAFYQQVAQAAAAWDGREIIIELEPS
ncbi:MAG: VOC family protein [Comamonadaceae bacterium]|jgi:hypothetical protein|nr:VOC family protein [Comamonadaceae bacterium]